MPPALTSAALGGCGWIGWRRCFTTPATSLRSAPSPLVNYDAMLLEESAMAELWMPGAEKRAQSNGGSMVGGPPRGLWHITWDSLSPTGKQPAFDNIANYLVNAGYCPHLMWDPWTGRTVQFYPATTSARALNNQPGGVETNRMGKVCLQVEVFFSPGAVRNGKKYATVADTPCVGLDKIMTWMRSWGIPDVWPMGWPKWSGNFRSVTTWRTEAGHYGHVHVPENDHTDPGPMPRTMFEGEAMALDSDDVKKIWTTDGVVESPPSAASQGNKFWTPSSYLVWGYRQGTDSNERIRVLEAKLDAQAKQLAEIKALLSPPPA